MKKLMLAAATAAILSACATTVSEPAPALFQGSARLVSNGIVNVTDKSVLDIGDVIMETKVNHERTGILENEVAVTKTGSLLIALQGKAKIPAGTKAYAIDIIDNNTRIRNLGWCMPGYARFFGIKGKQVPICAVWNPNGYVEYIEGRTNQSVYFAPTLSNANISSGKAPIIREEAVDFGIDLHMKAILKEIDKNDYDIQIRLYDDKGDYLVEKIEIDKDEDGSALFAHWGKQIMLIPVANGDKNKLTVKIIP